MTSTISRFVALILGAFTLGGTARADFFVGDPSPSGDNWLFAQNSLGGRYIRGAGNFDFDMYRTAFIVAGTGPLTSMTSPWTAGDLVIGMGGVMTSAGLANPNLTGSVRIVSKFTSFSNGQFTASPPASPSPNGTGAGDFSAGNGGIGSVLIGTAPGAITLGNAGMLLTPTSAFQWNGVVGTNGLTISSDDARYVYQVDGSNHLKSWEVLLNITKLNGQRTGFLSPDYDGHWDQALQRGTSSTLYTDAINQHMPVPPTMVAFAAGAAVLGLGRALRRRAGA